MSDHHRTLLRELGRELGAVVRASLARSPEEREAAVARWRALKERADASPNHDFRAELNTALSGAVDRLQALHDETLSGEHADADRRTRGDY